MSFSLTTDQVREQTKTVTRRNGWLFLKPGDRVQPVEKAMGLKKGEKMVKIGPPIEIIATRREPVVAITAADVVCEGFPKMTQAGFIDLYCKANKCWPDSFTTRIEYKYLNDD